MLQNSVRLFFFEKGLNLTPLLALAVCQGEAEDISIYFRGLQRPALADDLNANFLPATLDGIYGRRCATAADASETKSLGASPN